MWTDKEMNEYAMVLDQQEQAVLKALELGYKDLTDVKTYVKAAVIADLDYDYIESIHTLAMNPNRKVSLVD